jgi:hypothetical protein
MMDRIEDGSMAKAGVTMRKRNTKMSTVHLRKYRTTIGPNQEEVNA